MWIVSKFWTRNIEYAPLVSPDNLDVDFSLRTVINFVKWYHGALLTPKEVNDWYYIKNWKLERLKTDPEEWQNNKYMLRKDLVEQLKSWIINKLYWKFSHTTEMLDSYYEKWFITENDLRKLLSDFINSEIMYLINSPLTSTTSTTSWYVWKKRTMKDYHDIDNDISDNYKKILVFWIINWLVNDETLSRINYLLIKSWDEMSYLLSQFNSRNMSSIDLIKSLQN